MRRTIAGVLLAVAATVTVTGTAGAGDRISGLSQFDSR
ncbi:hypothetical protein SAMN02745673_01887 [Marinactinospora thermotolerans DSM 45154]|uniref:Uncharacterized protein n=1 Tax=Marinactinospora thermotolerans DSM 45154 TaxID=1122192 RepID=A0A1T4PM40_9ACTN|nr:hypothetical protein SAMN02745673_01887 [Marinactinospora thermotolerans DSM 45154]